jgi:hypothetical protein
MNLCFTEFFKEPVPRPVALDAIDREDDLYRMSYAFDSCPLQASIRASGLLHPLILQEGEGGKLRIVSGFRRCLACRDLGVKTVSGLFAAGEPASLFRAVLLENLSHRTFNPVEVSLALNRLQPWSSEKELVTEWLPKMGLDPSPKLLASHLSVWGMEEAIRQALALGTLNIGDVPALLKWPGQERMHVFRLFMDLKLGTNLRREIALNLFEIQKRDGTPPSVFLAREDVSGSVGNPDLSVPQKAQAVRGIVKKGRYPALTRLEKAFVENVKALKLPPNISIQHPPFFEGSEYRCSFTFRNGRDFQACVDRIRDVRHEEILPEEDHC